MSRKPKIDDNELVARAKGGDEEAYKALLERHKGCFWKACLRQQRRGADFDDCMSLCHEVLMNCVHKFDPDRGVKFITYLWRAVQFRMRDAYRPGIYVPKCGANQRYPDQVERARNVLSLDCDYGDGQNLGRLISHDGMMRPECDGFTFEQCDALESALRWLDERTSTVLRMRIQGRTLGQIGSQIGVSRERVRQIQEAAIEKIREANPQLVKGERPRSRVGRPRRKKQVA